jgi:hypothetical protein
VATLFGVTAPSTGQFYSNSGASISRIQDRLFVGAAALNTGTNAASQPDWLTQFQMSTGRTGGFMGQSDLAVLNGTNPVDNNTFVTAAQSKYLNYSGNVIGMLGMGVNNNTSYATSAYAGYNEVYRMAGTSGGAYGYEIDPVNYAGDVVTNPYQQAGSETIALQLAAGAGLSATGQYPSQAAINIQNNNSTYDIGINIGATALTGDNGTTGSGTAIALGKGHTIQWYGSAGAKTSSIVDQGTMAAGGVIQVFNENQVEWLNPSSTPLLALNNNSGAVNYVLMGNAATANYPTLQAYGSDTNVTLNMTGKGTGGVQIQGQTNGSVALAGYVGETISTTFTSLNMTSTSGAVQSLASLTLTPGDWYVEGYVTYSTGSGATMTVWQTGISTNSTNLPALGSYWQMQGSIPASGAASSIAPVLRQLVTVNTPVYLIGSATFSGGPVTATGYFRARRAR